MNRKQRRAWRAQHRDPDPGRAMIMAAAEAGLMTWAQAEELDIWAGNLATEQLAGKLSEDAVQARIVTRLMTDLARRGKA